jgi:hypothetical protein
MYFQVLNGFVSSEEDHGYVVLFGIPGKSGFLTKKQASSGIQFRNLLVCQLALRHLLGISPSKKRNVIFNLWATCGLPMYIFRSILFQHFNSHGIAFLYILGHILTSLYLSVILKLFCLERRILLSD